MTDAFAPIDLVSRRRAEAPDDWQPLPIPADAPEPPRTFGLLGKPSMRFPYHCAAGDLVGYVLRFEPKTFRPLRYGLLDGRIGWHLKGWAGDHARPPYRLPKLLAAPDAPVLLCEGEKAADAAADLLGPTWSVIASMNGVDAPQHTDWSYLAGRSLTICPDNDEPGRAYAQTVAALALKAGAISVRIVAVPDTLPDGWDLADSIPDGMQLDPLELIRAAPAFEPDFEEQGDFRVQRRQVEEMRPGVYTKVAKKDGDETWVRFASRLEILAYSRDGDSVEWGRHLAIHDRDGGVHHVALPMAMLAGSGEAYRSMLLSHGLIPASGRGAYEKLDAYLRTWEPTRMVRCVPRVGWHGQRFVLPDRTFGPTDETVVLQTERRAKFTVTGTLDGWQEQIAKPAVGNNRLTFAISVGFSGPLLGPLGQESGGFHFNGKSSRGKSALLHAGRSVWGCPMGNWRTTDNAAEAQVAGACDTLYVLDELSQAEPRNVDSMAYMLANGTGKGRARRDGGARAVATWRIPFLSSGEGSLPDKIAETTGKRSRAGQEVRVIDIPADAGQNLGVYDTLHDFPSGGALSDHLRQAAEAQSGHAAYAFLEALTRNLVETLEEARACIAAWLKANVPDGVDGQVGRVAARFALVAAAGEAATKAGVLPWPKGEASAAAKRCFDDWLEARGSSGPQEITAGLRHVRAFLEQYGSSRFEEPWPRNVGGCSVEHVYRVSNRAGFRRQDPKRDDNWEFYVLPEQWRNEVCKGFDHAAITKAAIAKGWMRKDDEPNLAPKVAVPNVGKKRLYCITSSFLAEEEP